MLTKDNVADEHHKLVEAIYAYDYYVKAFEYVQSSFDLNLDNPEHICAFWNNFWFALPDNPAIRRDPFNRICDMAEGGYLDNDDEIK